MSFGGNHKESSGCASPVAQAKRRIAAPQALHYLGNALLYLICCRAVPGHVMVDDKALASPQVGYQFVEEHVLSASPCVSLRFHLKSVVRVDEDDIAPSRCVQGPLQPVASMLQSRFTRRGSGVGHAVEG